MQMRKKTTRLVRIASIDGYVQSGDVDEITVYYNPAAPMSLPSPGIANEPAIWDNTQFSWNESPTHAAHGADL